MIRVKLINNFFYVSNHNDMQKLQSKNYGFKNGQNFELESFEVLYLLEKNKIEVFNYYNKKISFNTVLNKNLVNKEEYVVYKDLKDKGYKLESGIKYGFTFRVYSKDKKHALWLIEPIKENIDFNIKNFVAKNRIANSTRKRMLFAVVDRKYDISYFEINWKKF